MLNKLVDSLKTKFNYLNPKTHYRYLIPNTLMPKPRNSESGQVIVIVIVIIMVFLILIPLNIDLLQQESTLTIKDKNSTSAFQLAEAGLDRGYWKLKENNNYWSMIGNGYRLAGYTFDLAYSDIPSTGPASAGYYCVEITTHPTNNRKRIIRSIGIDKDRKETRALQAIYEVQGIDSAIFSDAGIDVGGNVEVHWGPVRSYQTIDAGSRKYPRMYSKQLVVDWDASYGPPTAGGDAVGVPPAQWFWWTEYDVPSRAQINFNAYRSSSIALGNNILCNDKGALVNPDFSARVKKDIRQALNVTLHPGTIALHGITGSLCVTRKDKAIVTSGILDNEKQELSVLLEINAFTNGTINFGSQNIASGLIVNSHGFIVGDMSTGVEMTTVDEGLGFLDEKQ